MEPIVFRGMSRMIEDLHSGISASLLTELFKKSICTYLSFVRAKPELLAKITGLSYAQILEIKTGILTKFSSPLRFGHEFYREVTIRCAIATSGIENFDRLLDYGFITGNIYELCGFSGCGKTQICMTTSVHICTTSQQQVLYIDSKNDISAHRFFQIAKSRDISNVNEVLKKISICHVRTAFDLFYLLHQLEFKMKNTKHNYLRFKLLVIDSLSGLFQQFHNCGESLSILNDIANLLKYISIEYQVIILLTNFVKRWVEEMETEDELIHQEIQQPALGKFWAHVPNVRIMVKKVNSLNENILIVLKSLNQSFGKSDKIRIADEGVI